MSDSVRELCANIRSKLTTLQSRLDVFEANSGSSFISLRERLDELRGKSESNRESIANDRSVLEKWKVDHSGAVADEIPDNLAPSDIASRAANVEELERIAIRIAEISFDEVERMVLEAIASRLEAEAQATH